MRSAPWQFVPLLLKISISDSRRLMNRRTQEIWDAVDKLYAISRCTARTVRHVNERTFIARRTGGSTAIDWWIARTNLANLAHLTTIGDLLRDSRNGVVLTELVDNDFAVTMPVATKLVFHQKVDSTELCKHIIIGNLVS